MFAQRRSYPMRPYTREEIVIDAAITDGERCLPPSDSVFACVDGRNESAGREYQRVAGRAAVLFLIAVLLLGSLCRASFAGERQNGETQPKGAPLAHIWDSRANEVAVLVEDMALLQSRAEELAKPLVGAVQSARAQFARLSSLLQASRGHPTEQVTLVQQMHILRDSLQKEIEPLEGMAQTLSQRLEEIRLLEKDLGAISKETAAEGISPQADNSTEAQGLKQYNRNISVARQKLSPAVLRLNGLLAPAKATLVRMDRSIADIEGNLISVWEQYYLTASDNTLDALASTPSLLADWLSSLHSRMSFAYPQSAGEWVDALMLFLLAAFFMGLLGFLCLRGARPLPHRWRVAVERVIKGSWLLVGIGLSILMASPNRQGGIYFSFVLLGALVIIAGVKSMSWKLRIAVIPSLENEPSPLGRLYPPAAIGILMLFSDLPTRILGIVWGLAMIVFLAMIFSLNRKHKTAGTLPWLERLSYGCAFWFGLASLLVAVAGYARLAILLFMVLFALVNIITLGNALMALSAILVDRVFSKTTQPVSNAVAQAVSIPLAWVLSLLCAAPWIWAVPGAKYLLERAMSANYTVGEASFDFSKVLIIFLLFFLFRSFISLGKASLEHLPERLPNIEKGVLPPLKTLLIYGVWALFAIIALGMLGVNFTSLAVVAGGLSVGIGFGMQNIFNNLISGLMLIFGRTILVGDYVEVAGASGTVRAINIRSTTIETPERALVYVPNSSIMAGQLTNWTRNSRIVRKSLCIGAAYGSDTVLVERLLLEAAKKHEHVLSFPAPGVFFSNFGASSLDFTLNVFIDNFDNAVKTLSDLRFAVERAFAENGIDIPFPQMTLHMPEASAGLALNKESKDKEETRAHGASSGPVS